MDDSQSYVTPQREKLVLNILVIQSPPQPHYDHLHCVYLENNIYVFKWKGKLPMHQNGQINSINQNFEINI